MSGEPVETIEALLTVEEFERLPEVNEYRVELVRGRLVREPRPGAEHGCLTAELVARLHTHVRERGLGRVATETGFLLADDPPTVRGPDVAFIAAERIRAEGVPTGFWRFAPDIAVEVVSPANSASEIQQKVLEYLAAGSRLVWVVDARSRSVTVYRHRNEIRVLMEGDALDGADVLPDFRLEIADLFRI